MNGAVTVRQLNLFIKSLLDGTKQLSDVYVSGEISNFKNHFASGHYYFTLKDESACIKCVMFRTFASGLKFIPENGQSVLVRGRVSVYEREGQYQLYCEDMVPAGAGLLSLEFERLKNKLMAEGLFDQDNKRKIPEYPKRIAVLSAETGAAVQDVLNVIRRRWPICDVVFFPVLVQGETAVGSIVNALERLYAMDEIDTVIIARGGGSAEDLQAFNSEFLARKLFESPFPVISGVGHETDFTICDFVADLRAPTPSAAAELATPVYRSVLRKIELLNEKLVKSIKTSVAEKKLITENLFPHSRRSAFVQYLFGKEQTVDRMKESLEKSVSLRMSECRISFEKLRSRLEALDPHRIFEQGLVAVRKGDTVIKNASKLSVGDRINIDYPDGSVICDVCEVALK